MIDAKKKTANKSEYEALMKEIFVKDASSNEKAASDQTLQKVMRYMEKTDFFDAPASQDYLNCDGGLLQHVLDVYHILMKKSCDSYWGDILKCSSKTLAVVAICHVFWKVNYYQKREDGSYTVSDRNPYGFGEKSVMMAESIGFRLSREERYVIRWHRGYKEPKEYHAILQEAMQAYPLILALYEADMEAEYMQRRNEGRK